MRLKLVGLMMSFLSGQVDTMLRRYGVYKCVPTRAVGNFLPHPCHAQAAFPLVTKGLGWVGWLQPPQQRSRDGGVYPSGHVL